jgi:LPS-assembly protein
MRRGVMLVAAAALTALLAHPARAQEAPPRQAEFPQSGEVLMQADELTYDRESRIVTATGNVELAYGERVLLADRVTYDENTGVVKADGNVALLDSQGDVAFADQIVLRNEMRDGVIDTLRVLLSDNSRMAGTSVVRSGGNMTTLHRGVYTACDICEEKGQTTPLWQIKAFRVIHNQEEKRIIYEDAFIEFFGVPVFYIPYFSQPDPTVKRQSGFLPPSISSSTELGQQVEIPYYWAISPDKDVTLIPRFTTKEGTVYQGEYRQRFESGQIGMFGTATWPETQTPGTPADDSFRGSLFGDGRFRIDDNWSWGFRSELTTDDTYLRKYGLSGSTDLVSNINATYAEGRNSFTADAYYFQGLLATDNADTTPWVAPILQYNYSLPEQYFGGRVGFSANAMVLEREIGAKSRRISSTISWERRDTTRNGFVFHSFANLRGDVYAVDDVPNPAIPGTNFESATIARGLPTIGVEWSYPLIRADGGTRHVIEPIAQMIYSPNVGNTVEIPNEDSLSFEFDDTNLFSDNRYTGLDQWETGARANVGFRYSIFTADGGQANAMFGQSFRVEDNNSLAGSTGLRDQSSDYVGRIMVSPSKDYMAVYRFRLDDERYKIRRNEVSLMGREGPVMAELGYAYFAADQTLTFRPREEIYAGSVVSLNEYWRVFGQVRHDLANSRSVSNRIGIGYEDECIEVSLGFSQTFYSDRDIEPDRAVVLRLTLKTLGSASASGSVDSN